MPPALDRSERAPLLPPSKNTTAASERALDLLLNCDDATTSSSASSSPLDSDSESAQIDIEREAALSTPSSGTSSLASVFQVVAVLLIGAFMVNADSSLVLATHSTIASQFHRLQDSSWLFTAFMLAGAATQALCGKLGDIYGSRSLVLISYILFAAGCALVGVGQFMWHVILGRVVSGIAGAAMAVGTSVIIIDLVPLRDVAAWQAGVNLAATVGRSGGGPLGGFLADTIGWRWSFLGQAPIFLLGAVLCGVYLPKSRSSSPDSDPSSASPSNNTEGPAVADKPTTSLARIDFLGSSLLAMLIFTFLLPIEVGGSKIPWSHPLIFLSLGASAVLVVMFTFVETRWAREPIFPLRLLRHRDVVTSYAVMGLQGAAQLALMFCVPLYFQVTERSSNTVAGAHLTPAVAGNALGTILTGALIKRSGRYKTLLVVATISTSLTYLLLFLRWRGHTNIWESLYIAPAGFGTGIAQAATFISTQAAVDRKYKAVATAGLYLTLQVGLMVGLSSASAVILGVMRRSLNGRLITMGLGSLVRGEIIENAASSVDYIDKAESYIATAVVGAYVDGLSCSYVVSFCCSTLAFMAAVLVREHEL